MNKDYENAVRAMVTHGGSFFRAIADAWSKADPMNKFRLETAFRAEFDKYDEIARVTA